ncbi:MAG: DUF5067 domain-containing protein, partial [Lachnospiraceae bacterium]|nr:DUF5067 domain-containing protein [Lachnospiraceae bacterium]
NCFFVLCKKISIPFFAYLLKIPRTSCSEIDLPCSWYFQQISEKWNTYFLTKNKKTINVKNAEVTTTFENNIVTVTLTNNSKENIGCEIWNLDVIVDNTLYILPGYMTSHKTFASNGEMLAPGETITKELSIDSYMPLKNGTYAIEIGDTYGTFTID